MLVEKDPRQGAHADPANPDTILYFMPLLLETLCTETQRTQRHTGHTTTAGRGADMRRAQAGGLGKMEIMM